MITAERQGDVCEVCLTNRKLKMKESVSLLVAITTLFMLVGSRSSGLQKLVPEPLIPCNVLGARQIRDVFIPEKECQSFSVRDQNTFPGNTVVLDRNFSFTAKTPAINGTYWFDGKRSAWRTFLNVNYAGDFSPPSLLEVEEKIYYLPAGCVPCPLDNLCVERVASGLIFKELDSGRIICRLDGELLRDEMVYPAGFDMVGFMDKERALKLADLKTGKIALVVADGIHWDIGNGFFVTPRLIFNVKNRSKKDISNLNLEPYTRFSIKKDHIEFFVDRTVGFPVKMLSEPQIVKVGFDGKLTDSIELKLPPITKIIDLSGKTAILQTGDQYDSDPKRLWAMNVRTGKENWSIDLEPLGSEVLKSWIVVEESPKLIAQTWTENLKIDIETGKIDRIDHCRPMQTSTKVVMAGGSFYYGQVYVYEKNIGKSSLVKTGLDGISEIIGLPFELGEISLDSDGNEVFIASKDNNSVKTAMVDAISGKTTEGTCIDINENQSVKLEKNILVVDGKRNLSFVDLQSGKTIELSTLNNWYSFSVTQSFLYAVCTDIATSRPILYVLDRQLNLISRTSLPDKANKIITANDSWAVMNNCVADCNGKVSSFGGSLIKLEGDMLYSKIFSPKAGVFKINLSTGEKTLLEGVSVFNLIRVSFDGYNFDGYNAFNSSFTMLQCPFRFTWAEKINGECWAGYEGMNGIACQLRQSPSYSVELSDEGVAKITNTSTESDLTGFALVGTFEGATVSYTTRLGEQQDFPILKPGQSFTFKPGTEKNVCLAIVSNGMRERNVQPSKHIYSGSPISDKEPETLYMTAWTKTDSGFERLELLDFDF